MGISAQATRSPREVSLMRLCEHLEGLVNELTEKRGADGTTIAFTEESILSALRAQGVQEKKLESLLGVLVGTGSLEKRGDAFHLSRGTMSTFSLWKKHHRV